MLIADWNYDGKNNLIQGNSTGRLNYWIHKTMGIFAMQTASDVKVWDFARVVITDRNNDMLPDPIVGDNFGNISL